MRLLVPVDGSDNANRAVQYAMDMTKRVPGAEIVLLNVQERLEPSYAHGLDSARAREHLHELGEQASSGARRLLDEAGFLYRFDIVFGRPAEVIARVADEQHCTGIVMGSRGLGDVQSLFLGSTSYKVVHLADVPVTLVR